MGHKAMHWMFANISIESDINPLIPQIHTELQVCEDPVLFPAVMKDSILSKYKISLIKYWVKLWPTDVQSSSQKLPPPDEACVYTNTSKRAI